MEIRVENGKRLMDRVYASGGTLPRVPSGLSQKTEYSRTISYRGLPPALQAQSKPIKNSRRVPA